MGQPIVIGFGVLGAIGLVLLGVGLLRGARTLAVAGAAILLALTGSWILGLPGVSAGLIALAFLKGGGAAGGR